jgi:hypothetical protein
LFTGVQPEDVSYFCTAGAFWGLEFHEWQGSDGPQYGHVATLEVLSCAVLFGTYKMLIITLPMLII